DEHIGRMARGFKSKADRARAGRKGIATDRDLAGARLNYKRHTVIAARALDETVSEDNLAHRLAVSTPLPHDANPSAMDLQIAHPNRIAFASFGSGVQIDGRDRRIG